MHGPSQKGKLTLVSSYNVQRQEWVLHQGVPRMKKVSHLVPTGRTSVFGTFTNPFSRKGHQEVEEKAVAEKATYDLIFWDCFQTGCNGDFSPIPRFPSSCFACRTFVPSTVGGQSSGQSPQRQTLFEWHNGAILKREEGPSEVLLQRTNVAQLRLDKQETQLSDVSKFGRQEALLQEGFLTGRECGEGLFQNRLQQPKGMMLPFPDLEYCLRGSHWVIDRFHSNMLMDLGDILSLSAVSQRLKLNSSVPVSWDCVRTVATDDGKWGFQVGLVKNSLVPGYLFVRKFMLNPFDSKCIQGERRVWQTNIQLVTIDVIQPNVTGSVVWIVGENLQGALGLYYLTLLSLS